MGTRPPRRHDGRRQAWPRDEMPPWLAAPVYVTTGVLYLLILGLCFWWLVAVAAAR